MQNLGIPPTNDQPKYNYTARADLLTEYIFEPCQSTVIALRHNKKFVDEVSNSQECGILLDTTCFYSEQGGQIYDTGFIVKANDDGAEFCVNNVQVRGGYVVHIGTLEGTLHKGKDLYLLLSVIYLSICVYSIHLIVYLVLSLTNFLNLT